MCSEDEGSSYEWNGIMTVVEEDAEAMRAINLKYGIRAIIAIDMDNAPTDAAKQSAGNYMLYNPNLKILSCSFDVKCKVWLI